MLIFLFYRMIVIRDGHEPDHESKFLMNQVGSWFVQMPNKLDLKQTAPSLYGSCPKVGLRGI